MRTSEVFGISTDIHQSSYVDRGRLDTELRELLDRNGHVALRGESKVGKSWLRKKILSNPIVFGCRHRSKLEDIYTSALSELGISLVIQQTTGTSFAARLTARGAIGVKLLGEVETELEGGSEFTSEDTTKPVGKDINDLRYIAGLIRKSGRRLVIEDFHYLSIAERTRIAFDLKALWDLNLYVVIIGVWSRNNMLLSLNGDLAGRITEKSISWDRDSLSAVLGNGSFALGIRFSSQVTSLLIKNSYWNVGILQGLTLMTLDEMGIKESQQGSRELGDEGKCRDAIMAYAGQVEPLYQKFAADVSSGIRKRKDSTGIYAHAMAVILEADDETLLRGLSLDAIFEVAYARENRIQKGNLKSVLEKIEELQVDSEGRGLVFSYNSATESVSVVDKQILLFREYRTVRWPWEDLIKEA